MGILLALALAAANPEAPAAPTPVDPNLSVKLIALEPSIVTPTSLAVGRDGKLYVIECLTHFRPDDYEGPEADRILVFDPTKPEAPPTIFYEGSSATMGIAFAPDGSLYVSTRNSIFQLRDTNSDGKADEVNPIIRMDSEQKYPHNGLGSLAFDPRGTLYFGIGENLGSPYAIVGTDGSKVTGSNEGGRVFRAQSDGSKVEMVAQGFWNPFALCFDTFGRLFVVDNDPDSRPPCRLIHVVPGGDYGFEFRHGRKGTSPFIAWDGELPGSLPMAAGTSEAPSGILAYESAMLPPEYLGTLLVTSWGDHRIERFALKPSGASFRMVGEPVLQGMRTFRPVGIATAPSGAVYFTDWVQRSYPIHGNGRIWEMTAKGANPNPPIPESPETQLTDPRQWVREQAAMTLSGEGEIGMEVLLSALTQATNPRARAAALWGLSETTAAQQASETALSDKDPAVRALALRLIPNPTAAVAQLAQNDPSMEVRAAALRRLNSETDVPILTAAFPSPDPFLTQAARYGLQHAASMDKLVQLYDASEGPVRENVLLTLRAKGLPDPIAILTKALADADPRVRMVALEWAVEDKLTGLKPTIEKELATGPSSPRWFNMTLEAIVQLDPESKGQAEVDKLAAKLVRNDMASPTLRLLALRRLPPNGKTLTPKFLESLAHADNQPLAITAVRALRESDDAKRFAMLQALALDQELGHAVRAEAVAALSLDTESFSKEDFQKTLRTLLQSNDPDVRHEAVRLAVDFPWTESNRKFVEAVMALEPDLKADWESSTSAKFGRPEATDTAAWSLRLNGIGNAVDGERLFFHPKGPGCYRCHSIHERGGNVGPSLTDIGRGMSHEKLLSSILEPSREMAPQWIPWVLLLDDGSIQTGVMLGESGPKERYGDANGKVFLVEKASIEERKAQSKSIMPEKLADQMSDSDFRNLLQYLEEAYKDQ